MTKRIIKEHVDNVDLEPLRKFIRGADLPQFFKPAGVEHYKFLAYLSYFYEGARFLDLGSRWGGSAVALSANSLNKVHSYDIAYQGQTKIKRPNTKFFIQDIVTNLNFYPRDFDVIMVDIGDHDGKLEDRLFTYLKVTDWKGVAIFDDVIHEWPKLTEVWESWEHPNKYDLTDVGHFTGTGVIDFSGNLEIV